MCDFDYDGDGDIDLLDDALLLEEELYNAKLNCEHAAWEMAREEEKRRKQQTSEKKYTFAESMKLLKDLFFNRN